jgi:hypothetical protein
MFGTMREVYGICAVKIKRERKLVQADGAFWITSRCINGNPGFSNFYFKLKLSLLAQNP